MARAMSSAIMMLLLASAAGFKVPTQHAERTLDPAQRRLVLIGQHRAKKMHNATEVNATVKVANTTVAHTVEAANATRKIDTVKPVAAAAPKKEDPENQLGDFINGLAAHSLVAKPAATASTNATAPTKEKVADGAETLINGFMNNKDKLFMAASKDSSEKNASGGGDHAGPQPPLDEYQKKDMPLKAQEHGFMGDKVQHVDGETVAADWHNEYPNDGHLKLEKPAAAPAAAGAGAGERAHHSFGSRTAVNNFMVVAVASFVLSF